MISQPTYNYKYSLNLHNIFLLKLKVLFMFYVSQSIEKPILAKVMMYQVILLLLSNLFANGIDIAPYNFSVKNWVESSDCAALYPNCRKIIYNGGVDLSKITTSNIKIQRLWGESFHHQDVDITLSTSFDEFNHFSEDLVPSDAKLHGPELNFNQGVLILDNPTKNIGFFTQSSFDVITDGEFYLHFLTEVKDCDCLWEFWRCLKVEGTVDESLNGMIAELQYSKERFLHETFYNEMEVIIDTQENKVDTISTFQEEIPFHPGTFLAIECITATLRLILLTSEHSSIQYTDGIIFSEFQNFIGFYQTHVVYKMLNDMNVQFPSVSSIPLDKGLNATGNFNSITDRYTLSHPRTSYFKIFDISFYIMELSGWRLPRSPLDSRFLIHGNIKTLPLSSQMMYDIAQPSPVSGILTRVLTVTPIQSFPTMRVELESVTETQKLFIGSVVSFLWTLRVNDIHDILNQAVKEHFVDVVDIQYIPYNLTVTCFITTVYGVTEQVVMTKAINIQEKTEIILCLQNCKNNELSIYQVAKFAIAAQYLDVNTVNITWGVFPSR